RFAALSIAGADVESQLHSSLWRPGAKQSSTRQFFGPCAAGFRIQISHPTCIESFADPDSSPHRSDCSCSRTEKEQCARDRAGCDFSVGSNHLWSTEDSPSFSGGTRAKP